MKELINILKTETQSLKEQYIQKTKEWAERHFNHVTPRYKWNTIQWCEHFGLTPEVVLNTYITSNSNKGKGSTEFLTFPRGFYNTKQSREHGRLRDEAIKLINMGVEKYIEKEVIKAEKHYEASIDKLAYRIDKKGLDISKLKTITSHIGVNINTTLTDGEKTVKAFTIIAEGPIQRPHYRYLIK